MTLEQLADFLAGRGLSLRSAKLGGRYDPGGSPSEGVDEFTCEPAESKAAPVAVVPSSPDIPREPDALDAFVALKEGRKR